MYDLLTVKIKPLGRIPWGGGGRKRGGGGGGGGRGGGGEGREREREGERGNLALVRKYQKPRGGRKIFLEDVHEEALSISCIEVTSLCLPR